MAHNKNADLVASASVNQGVRKTSEGKTALAATLWRAESRVRNQQYGDAFKFSKEGTRQTAATRLIQLCSRWRPPQPRSTSRRLLTTPPGNAPIVVAPRGAEPRLAIKPLRHHVVILHLQKHTVHALGGGVRGQACKDA